MIGDEHDDRLWDPAAEVERPGEHDELAASLEQLLSPLGAPAAPALELPARAGLVDATRSVGPGQSQSARERRPLTFDEDPSRSRGWVVALVSLAAALALWLAWRAQLAPPASAQVARRPALEDSPAPRADAWRVEALDGETDCRPADHDPGDEAGPLDELGEGALVDEGAIIELGDEASARLSSGDAQLELHPRGRLRHSEGVLTLLEGRAWVDLPARERAWQLGAGPLELETRSARFMVSVDPGAAIEIELVTGELSLVGGDHVTRARAGQLCRARFEPGPMAAIRSLECLAPP